MRRRDTAWSVSKFLLAQAGNLSKLGTAFFRPDFPNHIQIALGQYLDGASSRFDQSSSNARLSGITPRDRRNQLIAALCDDVATIYGANDARISLSGSSSSVRQVLGHVVPRARPSCSVVLLDPACHKSVFGGLIESGMDVVFLRRKVSNLHGIFGILDEEDMRAKLATHTGRVACVFVTNPTYEGFDTPLKPIAKACHQHGALLCIDSAWGSNYGIVHGWPESPIIHADIVVASPHKKGAAPSQVGVVLFNDRELSGLFDEAARIGYASTSPNWNLLLLFEHCLRAVKDGRWNLWWQDARREADLFRANVIKIDPALRCLTPADLSSPSGDPAHVYIDTLNSNIDAPRWAQTLSDSFQIDVELASPNGLLLLFGPGHKNLSPKLIQKLTEASKSANRDINKNPWLAPRTIGAADNDSLNPRAAYFAPRETCPLKYAAGSISATLVYAYPPGIPIMAYGERISEHHILAIEELMKRNVDIIGLNADLSVNVARAPPSLRTSRVIRSQSFTKPNLMSSASTSNIHVESFPFGRAPNSVISEVTDLFREVFCNAPYNQFAARTSDPTQPLSFSELAPVGYTAAQKYLPLDILDRTVLPADTFRWMEPGEFEARFRSKAAQLYISLVREAPGTQIKAFSIGRVLTVAELYQTEEFRNPVYYSSREFISALRDADEFFAKMAYHFGLKPTDRLFFALGYGAHPSIRGTSFLTPMMNALANSVSSDHARLPALAEVPDEGAGRLFSQAVHERTVYGLLGTSHGVVFASHLQSVMDHYRQGTRHIMQRVRTLSRIQKTGLNPCESDHPGVEIRPVAQKGTGVFATRDIRRGELIAEFVGDTYTAERESDLPKIMIDRCIQTGAKEYVFAENRLAEKVNHSCNPNCGIRERTKIVAIKSISAGEEVTWDYRMSENSDWVLERCLCGEARCAGRIEGYDSLPEDIRTEYIMKGAVSTWLLDEA